MMDDATEKRGSGLAWGVNRCSMAAQDADAVGAAAVAMLGKEKVAAVATDGCWRDAPSKEEDATAAEEGTLAESATATPSSMRGFWATRENVLAREAAQGAAECRGGTSDIAGGRRGSRGPRRGGRQGEAGQRGRGHNHGGRWRPREGVGHVAALEGAAAVLAR